MLPEVIPHPAERPKTKLSLPVMRKPAIEPIATLRLPVEFCCSVCLPIAKFSSPVLVLHKLHAPKATLPFQNLL